MIPLNGVTSEVIAEVRSRANLLEIISEFVVLKRAGKEHKGLCPFHSEKSPSFHVNQEKGIFKCFGCGEGGDVFAFVQKVKGLEFLDAVRDLAHRFHVPLVESEADKEKYDKRTAILLLYQQAAEYYRRLLNDSEVGRPAREYLLHRGISEEIIARFKLGYAPNVWDGLLRYLSSVNKVRGQTLEEAGLVRRRPDSSSYYDLFRNRLMIPIADADGRVIAFGGRAMADSEVKYINSPESPIYTKGQHLFGFHLAKEAIKAKDSVIVVEGYFDAIAAHQYGFNQTVATLGTALTDRQAKLLVRYTESKRVYLSFDTDPAGERAMERGVETLNQIAEGIGIELRVIRVPGGKDPDECLRSVDTDAGPDGFRKAIEHAPLLIDYQLERAIGSVDLKSHMGRIEGARRVVPILSQIKNSVGRGEYIRQWALRLRIREEELLSDVVQFRRQSGFGTHQTSRIDRGGVPSSKNLLRSGYLEAERQLLALFLLSRDDYERAWSALCNEHFIDPLHQKIKDSIEGIGSQFNTMEDLQFKLQDRLASEQAVSQVLVDIILKVDELNKQKTPVEVILKEGRARILQEKIIREGNRLRELLTIAGSDDELDRLSSKIGQLKYLETALLPNAKSEEELDDVKRKIETIMSVIGQSENVETRA